jgi:hypothetical protein
MHIPDTAATLVELKVRIKKDIKTIWQEILLRTLNDFSRYLKQSTTVHRGYLINNFYLCCTLLNDAFYVTQDYIVLNVRMTGER